MFLITALLLHTLAADPFPVVTLKTPAGAHEPQVAVGADGHVFVTYGTKDTVYVSVSSDSGATFGDPIEVGRAGVLSLGMRRGPRIVSTRNSYGRVPNVDWVVVISAICGERGGGKDGDVLLWASFDQARSWFFQGRLNEEKNAAREGLHSMAASDGRVFCAWIDARNQQPAIWGAWGGKWDTVPSEPKADESQCVYRPAGASICPCCHPSVAFGAKASRGPVVMWRNDVEGCRDMYFTDVDWRETKPTKAHKLGKGTWKLSACPMDGGSIAVDSDGKVQSVWQREGDIFLATEDGKERRVGPGVQPWMVRGEKGLYVVWIEKRGGRLFLSRPESTDTVRLAEDAIDPVVAAPSEGEGPVVAAWESGSGDSASIRVARVDVTTEKSPK